MYEVYLKLRDIGPLFYSRSDTVEEYCLHATGILDGAEKLLTWRGDRSAPIANFIVTLACPSLPEGAVIEHCACEPPPDDVPSSQALDGSASQNEGTPEGEQVGPNAFIKVRVGYSILHQLSEIEPHDTAKLQLCIVAVSFGTALTDYQPCWDVTDTPKSTITAVRLHVEREPVPTAIGETPVEVLYEELRRVRGILEGIKSTAGWLIPIAVMLAIATFWHR